MLFLYLPNNLSFSFKGKANKTRNKKLQHNDNIPEKKA